jgi:hypothetical protein
VSHVRKNLGYILNLFSFYGGIIQGMIFRDWLKLHEYSNGWLNDHKCTIKDMLLGLFLLSYLFVSVQHSYCLLNNGCDAPINLRLGF